MALLTLGTLTWLPSARRVTPEMPAARSNIAFFLPDLAFGGVERVTFQLADTMRAAGMEVELIVGNRSGESASSVPAGLRLVDLGVRRTVYAVVPLARHLRRIHPLALISAKDHANVVAVLAARIARSTTPVIATVHSRPSETLAAPERWTGHVVRRVISRAYRSADAVVGVSEGVAADVARVAPGSNVRAIHNPVITPDLLRAREARAPHRWLESDRDRPVIVWCGRLAPAKDAPTAVRAFAQLRQRVEARLLFVGDGPARNDVTAEVRTLGLHGDVQIVGYVDEPEPWIARADALLFTSRGREGLPTVLIEALALGTPVVATDCPSGPREILQGGKLGHLAPVGDVASIAAALERAVNGPPPIVADDDLASYRVQDATDAYLELARGLRAS